MKAKNTLWIIFLMAAMLSNALHSEEVTTSDDLLNKKFYNLTVEEFHTKAKILVGEEVTISGYLIVDNGIYLYSSLDAIDISRVPEQPGNKWVRIIEKEINNLPFKSLSGCTVNVTGVVKPHEYYKDVFVLGNISKAYRVGIFYIMALQKMMTKNIEGEPACIVDVLTDLMVSEGRK